MRFPQSFWYTTDYFYANPLRMVHDSRVYKAHENDTETPNREPYLECFCCPPNLVRTIAKVSTWAYSLTENGLAVNLYGGNVLETNLQDGSILNLTQYTNYPWNGQIKITIEECKDSLFDMAFRIPDWAKGATLALNGEALDVQITAGTYATVNRMWEAGDVITLDLPMDIRLVEGHPRIEEVRNQVAIKRGPIVYCMESPDLPEETSILDVYLDANADLEVQHRTDFLGGVSTIKGQVLIRSDKGNGMYRSIKKPSWESYSTQFVPYFAWSNRGLAEMTVFLPVVWR